ncbi:MAG: secretion system protein E [Piscirickettsiaceae bacterium CG_4_9_14_3_um_filter_43_564]|nr:Flp pilus assembly complex ATPase component [Thiomicrospira sp.]OIP96776.1 MAG: secretion system protein E [Thiomicrospira sp. CG2_30_44_34]PIQ04670.1 MAG: secretion system protein E [Piscirickettsiaceae bacterium CG18_big_fil_WC_8_21_14_2_50_44_103]PIU39392.1 MAG: secretion system protein E [Piscirickettsiaceae bacterium CG07_land_8_20_14_0_80_44_28]PIW56773.1 MAG: secretion system protein E [Piscirickettsiaceae bacterium CG12_big_fil_rev_8_21_14_0_65_44_934]PIW77771.1 MAG: secretion syste
MSQHQLFGDKLVDEGYITQDELRVALKEQKISGKKLGEVLITLGFLSAEVSREIIGDVVGFSSMSLKGVLPDGAALALISESFARTHLVMPISLTDDHLKIAMSSPDDILLLDKIKRHIKRSLYLEPVLVVENEIQYAIDHFYGYELSIDGIIRELETGQAEVFLSGEQTEYSQPMVRLVDNILTDAVKKGASDIHFEPEEYYIRIRYRIDGVLQQIRLLHKSFWSALVVRLKVMSNLDLTDQRMPQDGRMDLLVHGREIDFRVSSLPGSHGENFVLRILDRDKGIIPLDDLGLDPHSLRELRLMMSRPTGILLVTGPTGSGKTTTLYSMLNEVNDEGVNIMTLEDPVEYPMNRIRQTAINEEIGMTFAAGIRSLMRQDPDIILIGEIRDGETAEMALRAAMTGHQVFATLHTNSAIGAIPRLLDIGISPSILSGNIIGIMAQRLTRRLCPHCREPYEPDAFEKKLVGFNDNEQVVLYKAKGCDLCGGVGFKGRLAVLETLRFNEELDDMLLGQASQHAMLEKALEQGYTSMLHNALRRVRAGETTLEEISRIVDLTELV